MHVFVFLLFTSLLRREKMDLKWTNSLLTVSNIETLRHNLLVEKQLHFCRQDNLLIASLFDVI